MNQIEKKSSVSIAPSIGMPIIDEPSPLEAKTETQTQCAICPDEITIGAASPFECPHIFHWKCSEEWIDQCNCNRLVENMLENRPGPFPNCPLCRAPTIRDENNEINSIYYLAPRQIPEYLIQKAPPDAQARLKRLRAKTAPRPGISAGTLQLFLYANVFISALFLVSTISFFVFVALGIASIVSVNLIIYSGFATFVLLMCRPFPDAIRDTFFK